MKRYEQSFLNFAMNSWQIVEHYRRHPPLNAAQRTEESEALGIVRAYLLRDPDSRESDKAEALEE